MGGYDRSCSFILFHSIRTVQPQSFNVLRSRDQMVEIGLPETKELKSHMEMTAETVHACRRRTTVKAERHVPR